MPKLVAMKLTEQEAIELIALSKPLAAFLLNYGLTEVELEEPDEVAIAAFRLVLDAGFNCKDLSKLALQAGLSFEEISIIGWLFNYQIL